MTKIISFYYFWRGQCFASFSLDFTSKCSSKSGGDWWKLKSDLRSCLVSWGSDATLVTLGLETGIHKIRVDISKVEKRNKWKDPTVSGRWWCNIWVWPKPIHSPEYQINEGGAGKLHPPPTPGFFSSSNWSWRNICGEISNREGEVISGSISRGCCRDVITNFTPLLHLCSTSARWLNTKCRQLKSNWQIEQSDVHWSR